MSLHTALLAELIGQITIMLVAAVLVTIWILKRP